MANSGTIREASIHVDTTYVVDRPTSVVPFQLQMYLVMIEHFSMYHSQKKWDAMRLEPNRQWRERIN